MARRGRPPKSPDLKLITGNPGKRPIVAALTGGQNPEPAVREDPLVPPRRLTKSQHGLWTRFIDTAWWLTDHDVPKAYSWVCLQAEHDKNPSAMVAAKITQLRVLGSELGFDPAGRARIGVERSGRNDPTRDFFD